MSDGRLTWNGAMLAYRTLRRYGVPALKAWRQALRMAHPNAIARHQAERAATTA